MRRKILLSFIFGAFAAGLIWLVTMPSIVISYNKEYNLYSVMMNGTYIGKLGSEDEIRQCLKQARTEINKDSEEMIMSESFLDITPSYVTFGIADSKDKIIKNMVNVLVDSTKSTLLRSYTVKINDYSVNLASKADVISLISAVKDKYDENNSYVVDLTPDSGREINVLTASVVPADKEMKYGIDIGALPYAGVDEVLIETVIDTEADPEDMDFSAFELGLKAIDLEDKVEIVESYLPETEITDIAVAIEEVNKDNETNKIYEVKSGDTLSGIASKFNLTIAELIAMNANLTDENSIIRPDDQIIVTVPKPLLGVLYTTQEYIEEDYNLPVEYIDDENMYQDEIEVVVEGVTGHRKIIALLTYSDGSEISRRVVKQEISVEAVARVLRRGTKVRPTYVKPLSGGVVTSPFGYRNFRGSEFHSGVDFGVRTGTSVFASSSGVVVRAGWFGGYGYCVDIQHPDGNLTRYGHLSQVLVKTGQYVNQLERIALSGSTGDSTGPHLHFEIRVGGKAVNPFDYLE